MAEKLEKQNIPPSIGEKSPEKLFSVEKVVGKR